MRNEVESAEGGEPQDPPGLSYTLKILIIVIIVAILGVAGYFLWRSMQ